MKKYLFVLSVLLCGCGQVKYIVTSKTPTGVFDNCTVGLRPITPRAERMAKNGNDNALVACDHYNVGDTLVLNRKEFTNY
jgi:hypothetical protein